MTKPRVIAFYLPQYHPTSTNNKWWGKGFTEWTNVGKAKPLFYGHEQPKVPADLGYYDLRLPEVREAQAELARKAGIEGFCYYHYWFGDGHEELEMPFKEVVKSGKPDFPFCLCWANESWHKKFWNIDGTCDKEIIAQQDYDDEEGNIKHFYHLIDAFKDKRYIRIDNKLVFLIYKPLFFPNLNEFIELWNNLAQKNGLNGFYFIGYTASPNKEIPLMSNLNLDGIVSTRLMDACDKKYNRKKMIGLIRLIFRRLLGIPFNTDYRSSFKYFVTDKEKEENIFPSIIPNWDHTPRSGRGGYVLKNSTPYLFDLHVKSVLKIISNKDPNRKIVFIKSWNEWGEGNYLEPDVRWGHEYLEVLKSNFNQ